MKNDKIDIISLGCSKNLIDSEQLIYQLTANGYIVSHNPCISSGNIVIINTCGFIKKAKEESIHTILAFTKKKKINQIKKLFVIGCLSERYLNELRNLIPEVDKFYGKLHWKDLITDLGKTYYHSSSSERILTTPTHYAYVKIAEGCNHTCAFCAIPTITGKYRSRSIQEIKQEVKSLIQNGTKEFQIIAQDLTFYGKDFDNKFHLPELINCLSKIKGVEWIRLHYAYPTNFPLSLLKIIKENQNVCNYIDIAFQHSSNSVLKKMRRCITREKILQLISVIRNEIPDIHIRTTLLVGHPGEKEQDFADLISFVKEVRFERLGAFIYSEEEGTYSSTYYNNNIISNNLKKQRFNKLLQVQTAITKQVSQNKVNQTIKIIIDREEKNFYIGRTEYDSPEIDPKVLIKKNQKLNIGNFYFVKIIGIKQFDLLAEI